MANNQTQPAAAAVAISKEGLEEQQRLEDAMEHLKELHLQATEAYFAAFTQSVTNTRKEVAAFKENYTCEESKRVFQRAAESGRANPKGIKPWRYSDDPEWTTVKRRKLNEGAAK
ncbi:hypothetical protein B0H66DRAFT_607009 [Apodospora peruviana]|uniref:Uncharacterized protein n=1 Tax=Apodospora peruviana TaxID=516989 RepID=A0AAE0HVP0_9PEZI|nr:hypothetical protein B0H66DRAFT_607009 [Apodospora peruviana]